MVKSPLSLMDAGEHAEFTPFAPDADGDTAHLHANTGRQRKPRSGARAQPRAALGDASPPMAPDLPTVRVAAGKVPQAVERAEAILLKAGAAIYSRAGALVRPVSEEMPSAGGRTTTVARFRVMCPASMADHAARAIGFQRYDARAKGWVAINPPGEVIAALLAREGEWSLPKVAGLITTPTLRPNGSILSQAGYDRATRLYLALDPEFRLPDVPARPSRADGERALQMLDGLLSGFPFVGPVDRAVALSGIMTAVLRGAIPTAPLHAIRAHSPGTGKSFMVDIAAAVATGRRCPVIAAGKTEEETEKRLGALLKDAVPVVSIDNVNGDLGGDMLCQMTERPLVRVRILGRSEAPEIECRSAVFATGNNLTMVGDMTRRAVICTLDAGVERPELREFEFDPMARVFEDRGTYVAAVMTVARAYRTAGMPKVCGSIGSYQEWSDMVRAPLIWLGCTDPVASMDTARDEDPELAAIRALFEHWRETLKVGVPYSAGTIIEAACARIGEYGDGPAGGYRAPEFRELLMERSGTGNAPNGTKLGQWLKSIAGRIANGCRLEMRRDTHTKVNAYLLRQLDGSATDREPS